PLDAVGADTRARPAEQAALRPNERHLDVLAVALAQHRAQVAEAIGKAELDRSSPGPIFAREQVGFGARQPGTTALLHQRDEIVVNFALDRLEPLHVLRFLRQERIEHRLALARGVEAALDADLLDQPGEAERAADHADRSHD